MSVVDALNATKDIGSEYFASLGSAAAQWQKSAAFCASYHCLLCEVIELIKAMPSSFGISALASHALARLAMHREKST